MPSSYPTTHSAIDTRLDHTTDRKQCLPNLRVGLRQLPKNSSLTVLSDPTNEQPQSQLADQAPAATSPAPVDTIQPLSRATTTSTQVVKDNAAVAVSSADPLDLGRHRRSNLTQAQMKADYPQANKKRMKVREARPIMQLDKC